MFKNFLKIAYRNIIRNKWHSFIIISGLSIGMACCIMIMLWVMDEINYDSFHANSDNIYRLTTEIEIRDQVAQSARTPARLGPYLKETYPEVVNYARFYHNSGNDGSWRVRYGDKSFTEYNSGFAEPEFFEVFTFPLIAGDPKTALADPYSIVLTESTAKKYFGDEDPLGKTLVLDDEFNFIVNGIMKDIPDNSHMKFDFLVSVYFWEELNINLQTWTNFRFYSYIQLAENIDYVSFAENIREVINDHNEFFTSRVYLQPFSEIHLFSSYENDLSGHGDITYVYLFSAIALFILLIASFNFINLSTARANRRAKEVGLRKVVGAFRSNLVVQFLGESVVLSFLALFFALIITDLLLPFYNELSGKNLYLSSNVELIVSIIGIALFTGIVSGSYPAFFLSSFQPSKTLKGSITPGKRNSVVREFTVIIQFTLSIILIIATLLVYGQLNYINNMKLGFNKEHVLYLNFSGQQPIMARFESLKNELINNSGVISVEKVSQLPPNITAGIDSVRIIGSGSEDVIFMNLISGGFDLKKTFDFEMEDGRYFSREFGADSNGVVINETAASRLGDSDPIGKEIRFFNTTRTIIGIVKDFHLQSIREEISQVGIVINPDFANFLVLRFQSENIPRTLEDLNNTLLTILPDFSEGFRFLDDDFDALYRAEIRLGKLTNYSTVLAIIISCMGLLGLASHSAQQRTKEIGIRKTLGASNTGIVVLFSKEFTKWVIIANVIAWPVSYYLMDKWLQNFVYRIDISYWVFIFAGVISLVIAMITVSSQAIKASLANPVESLRDE